MTHTATASRSYCTGSRWSALNIVLMVIGFAVFWPLGLAMLAWIVWGDEIGRRAGDLKSQFRGFADRAPFAGATYARDTGNVAFDEYRAAELRRLEDERRKLEEMRTEFEGFLKDLRRVKDKEEFDRFMEAYRRSRDGSAEPV
jgi:hypothetical protein